MWCYRDPDPPLHAVACYRQVDATAVRQRQARGNGLSTPATAASSRITRNSVQKSVVMLCRLPVYSVQVRLHVAYSCTAHVQL